MARVSKDESPTPYASIPRCTRMRSALSFQTSIFTIWPPLTTKRSTSVSYTHLTLPTIYSV